MLVVFTTCPNNDEAESLARKLVEEKLAGCVQIVPRITSFYHWEGEIQRDEEFLLLIKTLPEKFKDLEAFIKANHSYSNPEIVGLDSTKVSRKYLSWMEDALSN